MLTGKLSKAAHNARFPGRRRMSIFAFSSHIHPLIQSNTSAPGLSRGRAVYAPFRPSGITQKGNLLGQAMRK